MLTNWKTFWAVTGWRYVHLKIKKVWGKNKKMWKYLIRPIHINKCSRQVDFSPFPWWHRLRRPAPCPGCYRKSCQRRGSGYREGRGVWSCLVCGRTGGRLHWSGDREKKLLRLLIITIMQVIIYKGTQTSVQFWWLLRIIIIIMMMIARVCVTHHYLVLCGVRHFAVIIVIPTTVVLVPAVAGVYRHTQIHR